MHGSDRAPGGRRTLEIRQEPLTTLAHYDDVPVAFTVRSVLDVSAGSNGIFELTERAIPHAYIKDFDTVEPPRQWADRFDLTNWGLLGAYRDGQRVGAAAMAVDTPGIELLEGRHDLAVLWDLRVSPEVRRQGVGSLLFSAAATWALKRSCSELKVEAQNVNVAACRFYERQGCILRAAIPEAYGRFPDEIQLLWYKDLRTSPRS